MEEIDWHDWVFYDETSPTCLRWKITSTDSLGRKHRWIQTGNIAGKRNGERSTLQKDRVHYLTYRIIYELHFGGIGGGLVVDHIDGDFTNNKIANLRLVPPTINKRNSNRSVTNTSGTHGVHFSTPKEGYTYWVASWRDHETSRKSFKHFSINKYGNEEAFRLAGEHREAMIAELNEQGAGYTHDHGKR